MSKRFQSRAVTYSEIKRIGQTNRTVHRYWLGKNVLKVLISQQSIPKIKVLYSLSCLKTGLDLECSSLVLNKHERCRNTNGTNHAQLIMSRFCLCVMKFLQIICLLNAGLEHSRSNLVFETNNAFIFGIPYWVYKCVKADFLS